ncbi:TPA: hypothetical protein ACVU43_004582 [Vibrio parahaemolyticus]|nr:CRISPR-associated endonuclease Cas2 [Vibrio parahaemolyticus]HBC3831475.1 CRISPR-associated endonuclease Cas2 [Vibrio parahaemolyticus]HBC3992698.1 CRISPR-associated endonuclease Cas2 [Vibrio parahaemolyticus]
MSKYFISYDLIKDKDYERLYRELNRYGAIRVLESVWCLKHSSTSTSDLRDHFSDFIDSDDRLLVIESAGWASRNLLNSPNDL